MPDTRREGEIRDMAGGERIVPETGAEPPVAPVDRGAPSTTPHSAKHKSSTDRPEPPAQRETRRIRDIYDRGGVRLTDSDDSWILRGSREWLARRARGETLEIGIGGGATMPHYPTDVRLTGIDLSPVMLAAARERATALGRPVDLRLGNALELEAADESFDTVVFCLVLCTVPDDRLAIREAARVLRPGGRLLAVEHVRSPLRLVRWLERAWEPMAVRQSGDHLTRDPVDHLPAAGFEIEALERLRLGFIERVMATKRPVIANDRPKGT